jgi:hypothetical protein
MLVQAKVLVTQSAKGIGEIAQRFEYETQIDWDPDWRCDFDLYRGKIRAKSFCFVIDIWVARGGVISRQPAGVVGALAKRGSRSRYTMRFVPHRTSVCDGAAGASSGLG